MEDETTRKKIATKYNKAIDSCKRINYNCKHATKQLKGVRKMGGPRIRMRTIEETANYFKQIDPDTAITKNCLRSLVKENEIPAAMIGTKYLLSLEAVEDYFIRHAIGENFCTGKQDSGEYQKKTRTTRI